MSPKKPRRPMDALAARVLSVVQGVDGASRLVSMVSDARLRTTVCIRAGDAHSTTELQKALQRAMPLSDVNVHESYLDGALEASILVFTEAEERALARSRVTRTRLLSYPLLLAWVFVLLGFGEWIGSLRTIGEGKDEL